MPSQRGVQQINARYPLGKEYALFAFLFIFSLWQLQQAAPGGVRMLMPILLLAASLSCLIYLTVRRFRVATDVSIQYGVINVNGRVLEAGHLGKLLLHGRIVGFLPADKRVVPIRLCVEVPDSAGRERLIRWAAAHRIEVRSGKFMRWL